MSDILYFSYGSNMLRQRLGARCPHIRHAGVAALADYRLTFGQYSHSDGSGKGAIEPAAGHTVYGVLWQVPPQDIPALDRAEGRGTAYERMQCDVSHDDGRSLAVMTYRPLDIRTGLQPWAWYWQLVLAGAMQHELPDGYINEIRQATHAADPQTGRAARQAGLDALARAGYTNLI